SAVNGTTYFYRVSAVNSAGEGGASSLRSATPATVPGAPTLASATAGDRLVALAWNAPVSNGGAPITNYKFYRGTTSAGVTLLTPVGTVTRSTDPSAVNGTTYFYKVSAVNSTGEGMPSNPKSATPATVPGAPVLTSATPTGNSVSLAWNAP